MIEIVKRHLTLNPCYKANEEKADSRYVLFQQRGPQGGMLHSVGCAQPDASVFIRGWNKPTYDRACVHGFIDANSGIGFETLPMNYRGWHCGGSGNNTHIGIEMCESSHIRYTSGTKFEILDKPKAQADCKRAYDTAVFWFAKLAIQWHWDVDTAIVSHKEGAQRGIASDHGDPEHYWRGLGMSYTMNGFRADVKAEIKRQEAVVMMTEEELEIFINSIIDKKFPGMWAEQYKAKMDSLNTNKCSGWSKDAREWAIGNGYISGIGKLPNGDTNYAWRSYVTREQLAQMEYKEAQKEGADDD